MRKSAWCLFLCLLLSFPQVSWASTYSITEEELTRLEANISELQTINNRLQKESSQQKKRMEELETQLTAAQSELQKAMEQSSLLGNQLKELERTSIRQEESLRIANESLAAYEKENNRTQKRLKAQRNLAYGIGTVLLAALVRK
ncbi:peptidase M24 [Acidaminococcus fermentans]|uniref:peptidase M24 n=1 Tax=Acidaminococcus fermentans TaxID=905 RepID=UPI001E554D69|nr:peptidase M24 [Acidaminococcus fermentans]